MPSIDLNEHLRCSYHRFCSCRLCSNFRRGCYRFDIRLIYVRIQNGLNNLIKCDVSKQTLISENNVFNVLYMKK